MTFSQGPKVRPSRSYPLCIVLAVTTSESLPIWLLLGQRSLSWNLVPYSLSLLILIFFTIELSSGVLPSSQGSSYVVSFLATVPSALLCPLNGDVLSNSLSCPLISTVTVGPVWEKQLLHYLWSTGNQPEEAEELRSLCCTKRGKPSLV